MTTGQTGFARKKQIKISPGNKLKAAVIKVILKLSAAGKICLLMDGSYRV